MSSVHPRALRRADWATAEPSKIGLASGRSGSRSTAHAISSESRIGEAESTTTPIATTIAEARIMEPHEAPACRKSHRRLPRRPPCSRIVRVWSRFATGRGGALERRTAARRLAWVIRKGCWARWLHPGKYEGRGVWLWRRAGRHRHGRIGREADVAEHAAHDDRVLDRGNEAKAPPHVYARTSVTALQSVLRDAARSVSARPCGSMSYAAPSTDLFDAVPAPAQLACPRIHPSRCCTAS